MHLIPREVGEALMTITTFDDMSPSTTSHDHCLTRFTQAFHPKVKAGGYTLSLDQRLAATTLVTATTHLRQAPDRLHRRCLGECTFSALGHDILHLTAPNKRKRHLK